MTFFRVFFGGSVVCSAGQVFGDFLFAIWQLPISPTKKPPSTTKKGAFAIYKTGFWSSCGFVAHTRIIPLETK
jgi:hypothetical protein